MALLIIFILFQIHTIVQKDKRYFGETIITHQSVCQMISIQTFCILPLKLFCNVLNPFFHTEKFLGVNWTETFRLFVDIKNPVDISTVKKIKELASCLVQFCVILTILVSQTKFCKSSALT